MVEMSARERRYEFVLFKGLDTNRARFDFVRLVSTKRSDGKRRGGRRGRRGRRRERSGLFPFDGDKNTHNHRPSPDRPVQKRRAENARPTAVKEEHGEQDPPQF